MAAEHGERKQIFSVLVYNHPGVLLRVSGLISRRGFNINSIVASETESPEFSRLTMVVTGDEAIFIQLMRQLLKLEVVVRVEMLDRESSSCSELLLIKMNTASGRHGLLKEAQAFGARVLDIGQTTMTFELSGQSDVLDRFTEQMMPYGIVEMARTGVAALQHGDQTIRSGLENE